MDPEPTLKSAPLIIGVLYSLANAVDAPPLRREAPLAVPKSKENSISSSEGENKPSEQVEHSRTPAEAYVPKQHGEALEDIFPRLQVRKVIELPIGQAVQLDWPSVDWNDPGLQVIQDPRLV